jgi:hypothetical protein
MNYIDAHVAFEQACEELALHEFKLFDVNWRYSRLHPSALAVRPRVDSRKDNRSACLMKVDAAKNKLIVGWQQPDRIDKELHERIKAFAQNTLVYQPRLLARFRFDVWEQLVDLVAPTQRDEFKEQIYGARLL